MAKRTGPNKSQLVRDYLGKHPDAGPSEVCEALKAHKIAPSLVSNIKGKLGGKKRGPKKGRKGAAGDGVAVTTIQTAAQLIEQAGGLGAAMKVLEAIGGVKM